MPLPYLSAFAELTENDKATISDQSDNSTQYTVYKVSDGFYQDGTTYTASTNFYIINEAGLKYFQKLVSASDAINGGGTVADYYHRVIENNGNANDETVKSWYTNNVFKEKTVHLFADIDLNNQDWTPIGYVNTAYNNSSSKTQFYGHFDGHNHTISNLKIAANPKNDNYKSNEHYGEYGLFGTIGSQAGQTFSNLTINNVTGVVGDTETNLGYVGILIGNAGSNGINIENCHVTGTINLNGLYEVGGFFGIGKVSVKNCSINADSGSKISSTYYAGALAGCTRSVSSITDSTVSGVTITAPYSGGMVGLGSGTLSINKGSVSNAKITGTEVAGSVIAWGSNTTISDVSIADNLEVIESDKPTTKKNGYSVAAINGTEYSSLQSAFTAATDGDTITLLADITLSSTARLDKAITCTLDGDGKIISRADDANFTSDGAVCFGSVGDHKDDIGKKVFTVKNVTFSKFKEEIIRSENCTLTFDGCTFTDNNITANSGRGRHLILFTQVIGTVKNSVFTNNSADMCINFNSQLQDAGALNVSHNDFSENNITGTGVIFTNGSPGEDAIQYNDFENNKINASSGAVIYCSGIVESLTNNLFSGNIITTTSATGKNGVIALGSKSTNTVINKNAFVNNTSTSAEKFGTIYVGNSKTDVSSNYWDDGQAPETGENKDIYNSDNGEIINNDYAVSYTRAENCGVNVTLPSFVLTPPAAIEGLVYNGSAQKLITAGTSSGGTLYYALGTSSTTVPAEDWSENIPEGTDSKEYYVWYKVTGSEGYADTEPVCIIVKISEALPKISDASITVTQGQTKTLEISDSTGSGTRTWTLNSDAPDWVKLAEDSDSKATLTVSPSSSINAGSYSCNVTVTNADSKTSTAKISITVEKDTSGGSDENNDSNGGSGSEDNNDSNSDSSNEDTSQTLDDYLDSFGSEEKATMTELKLTQEQKSSLTDSQLSTILTEFTALETLDLSGSTQITKLDAQGSETLSSINLEGCENLSNVDLGGCSSLSEIKGLSGNTTLKTLDTSGCSALESLDVSNCTGLTSLDCSGSSLGSLTVGGCTSLVSLNCRNNKLESLNADDCESLETLECGSNGMSKLSLKGCLNLQKLYCYSNNLESLEVPSQKLEWLVCDDNKLLNLDVSENKKLKRLDCQNNSMAALDIDTNIFTSLNWLKCYGQKIAKLIVSASGSNYHVNLGEYLRSNSAFMSESDKSARVTSDTSNIQSVKGYDKDGNEIELISYDELTGSALFASSPAKVSYGYKTGYDNIIMDVSIGETSSEGSETHSEESETTSGGSSGGCNIGGSILAVILACVFIKRKNVLLVALLVLAMSVPAFCDVAVNSDNFPDKNFLAYISSDIDLNHDGTLSSAEIESVTMIEVYDREIESLAGMEHFTALQELYCYGNKINSLNLSRNRELLLLECDNNTITRLDVSMNDKLINLECEMNNITELDLSNNANISYMKCYGQTRTGLVSSHDKSGSTYTVNLGQYVSDFTRVSSVSAYDGNGDIINNVSFDYETGIASMSSSPSKLRYIYDINYVNDSELSMDVTITGTAMTQNNTSKKTDSIGGSSRGCNFGVSAFALSALSLLLLMRRK